MSTPYDGYLRLKKRDIESIKIAISVQVAHVIALENTAQQIAATAQQESAAAAQDWAISTHAYIRARQRERAQVLRDMHGSEEQLSSLRQKAGEAYGEQRVAEEAASRFRARATQSANRRAQAEADDLSTARRLLRDRRLSATRNQRP
jgi:hypothetical protein